VDEGLQRCPWPRRSVHWIWVFAEKGGASLRPQPRRLVCSNCGRKLPPIGSQTTANPPHTSLKTVGRNSWGFDPQARSDGCCPSETLSLKEEGIGAENSICFTPPKKLCNPRLIDYSARHVSGAVQFATIAWWPFNQRPDSSPRRRKLFKIPTVLTDGSPRNSFLGSVHARKVIRVVPQPMTSSTGPR